MTQLRANLYGEKQGPYECVETFLLQKRALFDRLPGPGNDEEFMRPQLRKFIQICDLASGGKDLLLQIVFLEIANQDLARKKTTVPRPQVF